MSVVQDTKATELLERRVDEVMEVCGALRGSLDETEHKLDKLISVFPEKALLPSCLFFHPNGKSIRANLLSDFRKS